MPLGDPLEHPRVRPQNLAERIYCQLKDDIFEFRLLPGDRFSEGEIAARMAASRTPVRQALYRLEREGYLAVHFRSGWQLKPFDFQRFEELYDVRIVLELAAVKRLCERQAGPTPPLLEGLARVWKVPPQQRLADGREVARLDEAFHCQLVEATGNGEMARLHSEVSERIRILRRLDFTQPSRVEATYDEHARILEAILSRRCDTAQQLLQSHIDLSKAQVRQITLHRLHAAHQRAVSAPA
ncbi:GntR family transcriptional regulator [Pseudomonas sp. RP23018S]|uniref:GntR family transcriptional regulator n=1 Tax=Pseudomonas sp. RP23018S TaxID=3096037 RepID=UPI002ACAAFDC|nr:GntR family transcriptional regulator [Pseudomonas sp. RP23018S]MDZ5602453.1 GntR family transcriptional regulator [Pseudomonas sp. RP23018S]